MILHFYFLRWVAVFQRGTCYTAVICSLTEIETETEIGIISLSKTEMETEMFCETETKYKRNSEHMKRNSN